MLTSFQSICHITINDKLNGEQLWPDIKNIKMRQKENIKKINKGVILRALNSAVLIGDDRFTEAG